MQHFAADRVASDDKFGFAGFFEQAGELGQFFAAHVKTYGDGARDRSDQFRGEQQAQILLGRYDRDFQKIPGPGQRHLDKTASPENQIRLMLADEKNRFAKTKSGFEQVKKIPQSKITPPLSCRDGYI